MTISNRVKEQREKLHLTQVELAKKTGVTQQAILSIEKGKIKRPRILLELANALNVSPEWLSYGSSETSFNSKELTNE